MPTEKEQWLQTGGRAAPAFRDLIEEELAVNTEKEWSGRELEKCDSTEVMKREGFRRKGVAIG